MATRRIRRRQGGAALLIFVLLLVMGALGFVLNNLSIEAKRAQQTVDALAQAKAALIAYAATRNLASGSARPGDLPCPDMDNDGDSAAENFSGCGNAAGTTYQERRLGRLPWKTLGMPDIRDGSGERLWYAVSNNFKQKTPKSPLNSDSSGTITIRDEKGNLVSDASGGAGVIAVIIAPGEPLLRQDGQQQDRSAANINAPIHYLDNIQPAANVSVTAAEDNADFLDNGSNGFFAGPVYDNATPVRQIVANDRIMTITAAEISAAMESRVVGEISHCLADYAAQPGNIGRLPWAASVVNSGLGVYDDVSNTRFGRIPDAFVNTVVDSGDAMLSNWTGTCLINSGNPWFTDNWRELVFFAIADGYKPVDPLVAGVCGPCISVTRDPPSPTLTNRSFVVIVSGRALGTLVRSTSAQKGDITNYLESQNSTPADDVFQIGSPTGSFNDRLRYYPSP